MFVSFSNDCSFVCSCVCKSFAFSFVLSELPFLLLSFVCFALLCFALLCFILFRAPGRCASHLHFAILTIGVAGFC